MSFNPGNSFQRVGPCTSSLEEGVKRAVVTEAFESMGQRVLQRAQAQLQQDGSIPALLYPWRRTAPGTPRKRRDPQWTKSPTDWD